MLVTICHIKRHTLENSKLHSLRLQSFSSQNRYFCVCSLVLYGSVVEAAIETNSAQSTGNPTIGTHPTDGLGLPRISGELRRSTLKQATISSALLCI
jgi:hypothetical protein